MLNLARFELRHFWRAPSWWLLVLTCSALGFMVPVDALGPGMKALGLDAAHRTQFFVACSSLLIPMALMVAIPLSFHRDSATRFEPLSLCFPWRKRFWPKWIAVFAALGICLAMVPLGFALGLMATGHAPDSWTSWLLVSVMPAWFWFGAFNLWIMATITVWVSFRLKRGAAPYLAGVSILVVFWICQSMVGMPMLGISPMIEPGRWQLASLLDPFALTSFFEATLYWTAEMKEVRPFPLTGSLLLNRLIWLAISSWCFWRSVLFARAPHSSKQRPKTTKNQAPPENLEVPLCTRQLTPTPGQSAWRLLVFEARALLKSWPFLASMGIWAGLSMLGLLMVSGAFSEGVSPRLPATSLILSYSGEPFHFYGMVMAVIFSARILWRERQAAMESIHDSLPVRNGNRILAKYLALHLILGAMVLIMVAVGLGYQVGLGYEAIDFGHWAQAFYIFGTPLWVQGSVVFAIQTLAFARRLHLLTAMAFSAFAAIGFQVIPSLLHWNHPLLNWFSFPNLLRRHSEMRGYGPWGELFHHMTLLWAVALLPLLLLAWKTWPRPEPVPKGRFWAFAIGTAVFVGLAFCTGWLYQRQVPFSEKQTLLARAEYEKRFGHLGEEAVPQIVHSDNELDLFPDDQRMEVRAVCKVLNSTGKDLRSLLITARNPLKDLQFGMPFQKTFHDPILHATQIRFERPWRQGETLTLSYATHLTSKPFSMQPGLGKSATYVLQTELEPVLGYYEGLEIQDPEKRNRLGLPEKRFPIEDSHTRFGRFIQRKRTFTTRFSTSADQIPLTSGNLIERFSEEGRNVARFASTIPIYPVIGYFSGKYETFGFEAQGVPVTIYSSPGHDRNRATVIRSVREAIAYCSRYFGPYPYASLSVVEIPGTFPTGGRASAGVVALNEWGLFMLDPDPGTSIHTVIRRTVHEVVHQWFGEKMVPRIANGERVLNESLTKYVEARVVEKVLGPAMVRKINGASRHRYFAGRSRDNREAPLVEANAYYLCYGKGGLVFQLLSEALGEDRFNRMLHTFMERHGADMTATMPALVDHLLAQVDEIHRPLIREFLLKRLRYELRLFDVTLERRNQELWAILGIQAQAQTEDEGGQVDVTETAFPIPLTVAFYQSDPRLNQSPIVQKETVRVSAETGEYRIRLARIPKYILLDPLGIHLETDLRDNLFRLGPKDGPDASAF